MASQGNIASFFAPSREDWRQIEILVLQHLAAAGNGTADAELHVAYLSRILPEVFRSMERKLDLCEGLCRALASRRGD
jgi:hypothetical protein